MTDKNRTRYVQKEALYEVLQESVKDKVLFIVILLEIRQEFFGCFTLTCIRIRRLSFSSF